MCMATYSNFFNSYRRPGVETDYQLNNKRDPKYHKSVVVIHRKQVRNRLLSVYFVEVQSSRSPRRFPWFVPETASGPLLLFGYRLFERNRDPRSAFTVGSQDVVSRLSIQVELRANVMEAQIDRLNDQSRLDSRVNTVPNFAPDRLNSTAIQSWNGRFHEVHDKEQRFISESEVVFLNTTRHC